MYTYFPRLVLEPEVETPLIVPYSYRYDVGCQRRPQESLSFFCRYFDTVVAAEITWQPWAMMPDAVRDQFMGAREASRFRILLEGPVYRAWFLLERFLRQSVGLPESVVPILPPTYMRITERYTEQEMIDFTRVWDADLFRLDGDYTIFIQIYLISPLTDAHKGGRDRALATAERASGSRATQAHSKRGS